MNNEETNEETGINELRRDWAEQRKMTEQEIEMVQFLRQLSEHRKIKLTASFETGVWECELVGTPHPIYLEHNPNAARDPPNAVFVNRGVGTSFVEAVNNLTGNDTDPVGDGWTTDS